MSQIVGRKKLEGVPDSTGGGLTPADQNHTRVSAEPIDHLNNGGLAVMEYIGAMAQRVDETGAPGVTYAAEALPGSANTDAKWRIRRVTVAGSITTIKWATVAAVVGPPAVPALPATFAHVWDDRATRTYT